MKKTQIHSKCKACGNTSIIDPKHKLSTFIIKNPPKVEEKKEASSGSPDDSMVDNEAASDKDLVNFVELCLTRILISRSLLMLIGNFQTISILIAVLNEQYHRMEVCRTTMMIGPSHSMRK